RPGARGSAPRQGHNRCLGYWKSRKASPGSGAREVATNQCKTEKRTYRNAECPGPSPNEQASKLTLYTLFSKHILSSSPLGLDGPTIQSTTEYTDSSPTKAGPRHLS